MLPRLPRSLFASAFLIFGVTACPTGDHDVIVELTGPAEVAPGPSARAVATVYGYDGSLADVGADVIVRAVAPVAALPTELAFAFPADAHTRIKAGGPVPAGRAVFYVVVTVDMNGDGRICPGDLTDANPASPKGWDVDGPDGPVAFPLVVAGPTYPCRPARP
jgi:hypothetical protein